MIGLFDSGFGGLTIFQAVVGRFPDRAFIYLGDHANAPYGNRQSDEVVDLTRLGVEALFRRGCRLVVLACNTATAVACRTLQQDWLPHSGWTGHNLLGIIAPTVEAATQTPWAVTTPQYPQEYNNETIALFGTERTLTSRVYEEEISKRCPRVSVVGQVCGELAGAIEAGADEADLEALVAGYVGALVERLGAPPDRAILGCTHYPLVESHFRRHLPPSTRLLSQPKVVADSLEYYLARHPEYGPMGAAEGGPHLFTTGEPAALNAVLGPVWGLDPACTSTGWREMG